MAIQVRVALEEDDGAELRTLSRHLQETYLPASTVEFRPGKPAAEEMGAPGELVVALGGPAGIVALASCIRTYLSTRKNSVRIEHGRGKDRKVIELTCSGDASAEVRRVVETIQSWNDKT
jgi:hypothetical protein